MNDTIEIVKFKLRNGSNKAHFLAANAKVNEWVYQQPGFIMRQLCHMEDEVWLDLVHWQSEEEAARAMLNFRLEMGDSEFLRMIAPSSIQMSQGQLHIVV